MIEVSIEHSHRFVASILIRLCPLSPLDISVMLRCAPVLLLALLGVLALASASSLASGSGSRSYVNYLSGGVQFCTQCGSMRSCCCYCHMK
jgi:hypothetical protein